MPSEKRYPVHANTQLWRWFLDTWGWKEIQEEFSSSVTERECMSWCLAGRPATCPTGESEPALILRLTCQRTLTSWSKHSSPHGTKYDGRSEAFNIEEHTCSHRTTALGMSPAPVITPAIPIPRHPVIRQFPTLCVPCRAGNTPIHIIVHLRPNSTSLFRKQNCVRSGRPCVLVLRTSESLAVLPATILLFNASKSPISRKFVTRKTLSNKSCIRMDCLRVQVSLGNWF